MKHIVCYSGGHSSALVAIETAREYGAENVVLLNHNLPLRVESQDIKRFKVQVSNYLGIPITYANVGGITNVDELPDQFDVVVEAQAFKVGSGSELCTSRLKTRPFTAWLENNVPDKECVIYYGFDDNERVRIQRRSGILGAQGYKTDYPLAFWEPSERTIYSTEEIGIAPPMQYDKFKHANCIGCLKAGKQHWYIVYCTRPDIYAKGKWAEDEIGYTINRNESLEELEPLFATMKLAGIPQSEHIAPQRFWSRIKAAGINTASEESSKPCECVF